MKLTKSSRKYLEIRLAQAIKSLDSGKIRLVLDLVGRKLTPEEKVKIDKRIPKAKEWERIYLAEITGNVTHEIFIAEVTRNHSDKESVIRIHKPTDEMIDALIDHLMKEGQVSHAYGWAQLTNRSITEQQAQISLEIMTTTGRCWDAELTNLIKFLPAKKLSDKQKELLQKVFIKQKNYSGFWQAGGTKKSAPKNFFENIILELNNTRKKDEAITIISRENLWGSKKINQVFTGFASRSGGLIYNAAVMLKEIQMSAPSHIIDFCAISIIKDEYPFYELRNLGFKINDTILKHYLLYLKTLGPRTSGWPHNVLIDSDIKSFHRKLTKKEKEEVLIYIARTGNLMNFFSIANKYHFKPTVKMLRTIDKK